MLINILDVKWFEIRWHVPDISQHRNYYHRWYSMCITHNVLSLFVKTYLLPLTPFDHHLHGYLAHTPLKFFVWYCLSREINWWKHSLQVNNGSPCSYISAQSDCWHRFWANYGKINATWIYQLFESFTVLPINSKRKSTIIHQLRADQQGLLIFILSSTFNQGP